MGIIDWARLKSPWVLHFNTGGCNGCDIEALTLKIPKYDLERIGIVFKGSPRHADVLVVTGPVTRQIKKRLLTIYEQMIAPKFVVAVGACAITGGVFKGCYNVDQPLGEVIPVNMYIPGCPSTPENMIKGILKLTNAEPGETK